MSGPNLSFEELLHSSSSEADDEHPSLLGVSLLQAQQDRRKTLNERNELLALRAALKKEIQELRLQLLKLRVKMAREEDQRQRKRQSEPEMVPSTDGIDLLSEETPSPNEAGAQLDLQKILEFSKALPSQNLAKRMQYLLLLCPFLEVLDPREEHHPDSRMISFTIQASAITAGVIFKCKVQVIVQKINGDDVVLLIILPNRSETVILSLLSLSYYALVVKNYLPNKKLNLLMYSFNSLAELVEKRLLGLSTLVDPTSLATTTTTVAISINNRQVRLLWLLVLVDTITGELESQIQASLVDDLTGDVSDISLVISMLLRETSLKEAVDVVSKR